MLLFSMGLLCTGLGQYYLGVAIKKANRTSLIVLSMGFVVVFSAILLTLRSIVDAATREGGTSSLLSMGTLCGEESHAAAAHPDMDRMKDVPYATPLAGQYAPPASGHGHFVYDDDGN